MKKVRINTGTVGLVFKNGNYNRVITEGVYWLRFNEELKEYDLTKQFTTSVELNILLKDEKLAQLLTIVQVKDNEIVLQFVNGNFKNIFTSGRYAFWKDVVEYSFITVDLSKIEITEDISMSILQRAELTSYLRVYVIESYEKGLLVVNGKVEKMLESGTYLFWKNSIPVSVLKADLRQLQMEISGQEILTKDKAALRLSFYAKYKTVDIEKALKENKEYEKQLYIILQLALREFIGMNILDELLERKESISANILNSVKEKATVLGVEVLDCGIRDIILPGDVKEIFNQVLIAEKKAQANIITRREETASTRSLLNTAKLMEDNTMLFKLKEMEYVEKIADKINNINVNGGNLLMDQLRDIFSTNK